MQRKKNSGHVETESDILNEYDPNEQVKHLREQIAALERERDEAKLATGEALEIAESIRGAIAVASPVSFKYVSGGTSASPSTHVLHLTDLHYGAIVNAEEVDGFGEYSPSIAERRIKQLTQSILDKTAAQRHAYNVPNMHIIGTADYISGDIHPELQVSNAFPSPVQAVRCGYLLGGMLMAMAPHFEHVTFDALTLDNHGRLTTKPQATQGGMNNWSYIVAEIVKQHVAAQENVTVNVHAKPSALVAIGPERYLAMHGHQIRGWAGKPYYGFDRRAAMEAVKRMGVPEHAFTKLLLGHFHHGFNADVWMLGGSLSGTDAFDHSCGRFGKPHQTAWFVHETHGEYDWTRWRVK